MGIGDVTLMDALKTRMRWHQARQRLIAENVANADSPGYRAKDLAEPALPAAATAASGASSGQVRAPAVALAVTSSGHMAGSGGAGGFKTAGKGDFEVRPSGNAVDLEEQMTKSAENQLDYQTAASLYQQSLGLLRVALGRK
ncbi:flagellar basal body rod protein FlgB [Pinisolibacter aquiterrae]|uniref:flagellar basal body rod protein FlgB n=1 Tax=Pinisolibacter aquiterrae TaxID=2815579 RepID=UPI001C3C2D8A|nr:flagellar basal body rod protein FlgB [Pinisolibacter aquiterrae]MBV5265327.1 flagellar basal body rod protein FlgB [Pinisolibacter aquiterrae]MCC8235346.1 flagellar basal body rod protein FlgB [Pinisolibacter aquiterrae]